MKTVKYICSKCGYSEKPNKLNLFFYFIVHLFAAIGMCTICFLLVGSYISNQALSDFMSNNYINTYVKTANKNYGEQLREIGINITQGTETDNSLKPAILIFEHLKKLPYISSSVDKQMYNPLYVYKNGGDCKNFAVLYASLLRSIGHRAHAVCSYKYKHCIVKVPIRDTNEINYHRYAVVDLANDIMYIENNISKNIWLSYNNKIKSDYYNYTFN